MFGALVDAAAGRLEGDDAYITVDAVRRMAAGRVGPTWDDDFDAMLDLRADEGLARRGRQLHQRPPRVEVTAYVGASG